MARPKTFRTTMSASAIGGQGVPPLLAARLSPQGREIVWAGLCRTSGPYFSGEWRHSVSGVGDVRLAIVARGWVGGVAPRQLRAGVVSAAVRQRRESLISRWLRNPGRGSRYVDNVGVPRSRRRG